MDPGRWARMKEIFQAARECEPAEREARLRELCAGDEALRTAVNGMLARDSSGAGFLEAPALEIEARAMARGLDGAGVTDSRADAVPADAKRAPAPIELSVCDTRARSREQGAGPAPPARLASPVVGPVSRRGLSRRLPAEDLVLRSSDPNPSPSRRASRTAGWSSTVVQPGGATERAGLRPGDVLVARDGQRWVPPFKPRVIRRTSRWAGRIASTSCVTAGR